MASSSKMKYRKKNYRQTKQKQSVKQTLMPKPMKQVEKKYYDVVYNAHSASQIPTIRVLNDMASGTAVTERIGNRINLKSIQISTKWYKQTTAKSCHARISIIYDKNAGGALPSLGVSTTSGIYDNRLTVGTPFNDLDGREFLNLANKDRYVVLYDKSFAINLQYTGQEFIVIKEKYIKLNTFTQYSANTGGIASINQGALYLICMTDIPSGLNEEPLVDINSRLRYTDE